MDSATKHARGTWTELSTDYESAVARLPQALKDEGFGVITQIDMQQTLKGKLGVDFRRYQIFGACNPKLAHRALLSDLSVGVMLPCNVVLYENEAGRAVLGAVDPLQTLGASANDTDAPELAAIAREVSAKLANVIEAMAKNA